MACAQTGKCDQAYRKGGSNAVHCRIQTDKGGKWDFCAHQYMCRQTGKYEISREANGCPARKKLVDAMLEKANEAIAEAKQVIAAEESPFDEAIKKSKRSKRKAGDERGD